MNTTAFDIESLLKDELFVSKLEVSQRQILTAIRMFFDDADPVSMHTVIAAVHGVVRDIALHRGITKSFKDSPLISDAERGKYIAAVHMPQNFFKHAKDDPDGRMVFRHGLTPLYLLDAITLYVAIGGPVLFPIQVFLMWVQLRFPSLLAHAAAEVHLAQIRSTTTNPEAFRLLGRVLLFENEKKPNQYAPEPTAPSGRGSA